MCVYDTTLYRYLPFIKSCYFWIRWNAFSIVLAKWNMGNVLIARLYLSFHLSTVGYSKRVIYGLYALLAMCCLAFAIWTGISVRAKVIHPQRSLNNSRDARNYHICAIGTPISYVVVTGLFDLILLFALGVLFKRPLSKLFVTNVSNAAAAVGKEDVEQQARIKHLSVVCSVLSRANF